VITSLLEAALAALVDTPDAAEGCEDKRALELSSLDGVGVLALEGGSRTSKGAAEGCEEFKRALKLCSLDDVLALEGGPRTSKGAAEPCEEFKRALKLCSLDDVLALEGGPRTPAPKGAAEPCEEFKRVLNLC
jgi:hypothetical protein